MNIFLIYFKSSKWLIVGYYKIIKTINFMVKVHDVDVTLKEIDHFKVKFIKNGNWIDLWRVS